MHQLWLDWTAIWHVWWPLIIIIALNVIGWPARALEQHHQRRLELERARHAEAAEKIILEREVKPPKPEGCQHRHVTPVYVDAKLVAWLCMNRECGEDLPPDYDFEGR